MPQEKLAIGDSRILQLRRLLVPNWLWQLTWLRRLPGYYRSVDWKTCDRPGWKVFLDLLYIFFRLRQVPEHYAPCRLWEHPRPTWVKFFGSPYTPIAWGRFAKRVYPYANQILYNDKVVCAKLSKGLSIRQPALYGRLEPDEHFAEKLTAIFEVSGKQKLMLKPVFGRSGIGVSRAEKTDGGIIIRTSAEDIPLANFRPNYPMFLQEVIQQHADIAAIWNSSVNTMRVVTMLTAGGDVIFICASMRFGRGTSIVDNWSSGGLSIGLDPVAGKLTKFGYGMGGNIFTQHPNSGFTFEGFQIPAWPAVLDAARTIQRELPFSRMSGVDICVDETGVPVLIEINGFPDLVPMEQLNGPLLANPQILKAFAEYGLLTGPQKRLLAR